MDTRPPLVPMVLAFIFPIQRHAKTTQRKFMRIAKTLMLAIFALWSASAFSQGKATIAVGHIEFRAVDSDQNKQYRAYGENPREDTRAFGDMLATALVKTNKFDVIERDRMAEILKEQQMSMEGIAKGGFEGRGLNLQGVDYVLTGAITEYGTSAKASSFGGFSSGSETARMAVDIRLLEVATGQIGLADTISAEAKMGGAFKVDGVASTGGTDSGAAMGEVMRKTAQGVTNLIVTVIYPIKVVRVQANGEVMLNYGNSMLAAGNVLDVFSQGEAFVDPDTGEELGREEEFIGKLEIISAQARFSKARIVEGDGIADGMLARITNQIIDKKGEAKTKKKRRLF